MKQASNKILLTIIGLCMIPLAYGQETDLNSETFMRALNSFKRNGALRKKMEEIKPAYLFKENYLVADIYTPAGKTITGNKFKLDLQASKLYFLDSANEEMEVVSPVKKVLFIEQEGNRAAVSFEKGFPPIDRLDENNYYQVLVSGKASLLLSTKFVEVSEIEYPSGLNVKRTDKLSSYYGSVGPAIVRLSKTDNITELFSDKSKEIATFIQHENIKVKKKSDLEKVFAFYNNLFQ